MSRESRLRFAPKEGLFWLLAGFPIFFLLRLAGQFVIGDVENLQKYIIWAAFMAVAFALLSTFTKILGK
ncbi:hypothetical protein CHN51_17405 [Sphingorhabdus sp. YGSMI21]|nr:hypothetical protein CHN51_17405 [Sphingorhabdus sp. YGSMI21]